MKPRNPAGKPRKFKKRDVQKALEDADGNVTAAAKVLGCNPGTIYDYMKRFPDLEKVREAGRNIMVDKAERVINDALKENSLKAAMFILQTQGKQRGWARRKEVDLTSGGKPFVFAMPKEEFGSIEDAATDEFGAGGPPRPTQDDEEDLDGGDDDDGD